jgi:hypothetical protein
VLGERAQFSDETGHDIRGTGGSRSLAGSPRWHGSRNHALVVEQLFPGEMATLIRDGQPLQLHFDALIERLPTTGTVKMDELIHAIIHIDDSAVIRAPYTFTFDGKIDHCGTNIISLIRRNDRRVISGIADNSKFSALLTNPGSRATSMPASEVSHPSG